MANRAIYTAVENFSFWIIRGRGIRLIATRAVIVFSTFDTGIIRFQIRNAIFNFICKLIRTVWVIKNILSLFYNLSYLLYFA